MTKAKALSEKQWLTSNEPYVLLRHLQQHCLIGRAKGGKRRQRLYACACCRRAWHLYDERERGVIEVAERAADGKATRAELAGAASVAEAIRREREAEIRAMPAATPESMNAVRQRLLLAYSLQSVTATWLSFTVSGSASLVAGVLGTAGAGREHWIVADLLRDIFRNPFRPALPFDRAALAPKGSTAERVARTIYDEQHWDEMPVLADALEEAGCADADLLAHCRATTPHARGCWAVDLVRSVD